MAEIDRKNVANTKINYVTKGSEVKGIEGTFKCKASNGFLVWGTFTSKEMKGIGWEIALTLPEIAQMMSSMDGKNHKVFWRKERNKGWKKN